MAGASPDGRFIYYVRRSGGEEEADREPVGGLAVSPDGRSILFALTGRHGGDLMLVENFRKDRPLCPRAVCQRSGHEGFVRAFKVTSLSGLLNTAILAYCCQLSSR